MKLQGKVVVITGAGSGMGRAMANLFAAEGAKIVAGEWNETTLTEVVAEVKAAGGEIVGVQGDVSKQSDAESIVEAAVASFGRIDVLCNNAGVMDTNQGAAEITNEMWDRVIGINLNGPMYLTRKAVPEMLKGGGGSIINTASVAGLGGGAAGLAYTVSKHGLVGMTRQTAWRYGQEGVRCNAIAAGAVETNIVQSVDQSKMDPAGTARCQAYYAAIPGQLKAKDIADLALFLASDDSKMINGAIIPADAGWSAA
ncbi:MAG: SDR family oxidoreductase [Coriobacteriia bacterium]|nr:SDR family oxidoreductase [Coriobacteriia bacterium]